MSVDPKQMAQAFRGVSSAIEQAITGCQDQPAPLVSLIGVLDGIRAQMEKFALLLDKEAATPQPAPAGSVIMCTGCLGDAMQAMRAGQPTPPIYPAVTIAGGTAICNRTGSGHELMQITPQQQAAMARGEQVTPGGIVLASGGNVPR